MIVCLISFQSFYMYCMYYPVSEQRQISQYIYFVYVLPKVNPLSDLSMRIKVFCRPKYVNFFFNPLNPKIKI